MLRIPDGFLDLSPEKGEVFYFVRNKLFEIVSLFGFSPIITSSVEFTETFKLSGEDEEFFFNYIDPYDGKPACFRYDFTPQIGRYIKNKDLSNIYKIYYDGSVFRNEKTLKGKMREIFQAGVEIINNPGIEADKHLILLIKKIVDEFNLKEAKIFLNDINIFNSVSRELDRSTYLQLKNALIYRDLNQIESILLKTHLEKIKKDFIQNLPFLCGGIEIIDLVERKYNLKEFSDSLKNLKKIYYETINIEGGEILIDLAELRGFDYHNGLVFDVYSLDGENKYLEIITGGRYDGLLKKYTGRDIPATGFAIDLINLIKVIDYSKKTKVIILTSHDYFNKAYMIGKKFMEMGYKVEVNIYNYGFQEKEFDLKIEVSDKIFISGKNSNKRLMIKESEINRLEKLKEIL